MKLILLLIFLFSMSTFASNEVEFLNVCRSNEICSSKLDSWGGEVKLPDDEIQKLICENREAIVRAAKAIPEIKYFNEVTERFSFFKDGHSFYIKPEILAACLLAEHMLLYDINDELVDLSLESDPTGESAMFLVSAFASDKKMESLSVGPAQVQISTAMSFYPILNGLPKTSASPSIETIVKELLSDGAFLYGAAVLGEAVQSYARYANPRNGGRPEHFDIRDNPGIQCTIYQIGDPQGKALARWRDKRSPRSNYYGLYANMFYDLATQLIDGSLCE